MDEEEVIDQGDNEWGGGEQEASEDNAFQGEPLEQSEPDQEPESIESESVEEPEVEASAKPKHRVKGSTRINQLTRKAYQAEHQANQLRAENERLKKMNESSNQAAMVHYDSSVKLRLDRAKQVKAQAIENGDVNAQVEADVELGRIASQMEQLEAYKANEAARDRQPEPIQQQRQEAPQQQQMQLNEETENWLQENTWFVPNSPDFDPDLHAEVQAHADALDRKLRRTGREDLIMSKEYFDEINDYVQREFYEQEEEEAPPPKQSGNLTMKAATNRAPVAPVGKSAGKPSTTNPKQITLTAAEKEMCRYGKIDPEQYVKQKAAIARNEQTRGAQRRG